MKLIKFGAKWCGPCKVMVPIVENILNKNSSLEFEDIDIEDNINLTDSYNIKSVPTFVIVDGDDVEIARTSGSMSQVKFENWLATAGAI